MGLPVLQVPKLPVRQLKGRRGMVTVSSVVRDVVGMVQTIGRVQAGIFNVDNAGGRLD